MTSQLPSSVEPGSAILSAIASLPPDADTACAAWTVHDLVAHLAAGADELASLIEAQLAGRSERPTRPFEEREAPYRALAHDQLITDLIDHNLRLLDSLEMLGTIGDGSIAFTGTRLTAPAIAMHLHSEAALHRWDLLGSDDISEHLLSQADLTAHAVTVLSQMSVLDESARAIGERAARERVGISSLALASPDGTAVLLRWDGGSATIELADHWQAEMVVELRPHDRLLALWGRRSTDFAARTADGRGAEQVLDAVLWAGATPWAPRSTVPGR